MEREEAERKTETLYNKLNELASKITTITGIQITSNVSGVELLITKVSYLIKYFLPRISINKKSNMFTTKINKKISEIVNESAMMKGKLMTKDEKLTQIEAENKANRETIQRLVNELNKFEKDSVNNKLAFESLKAV
jgi:hypothetical protein